VRWRLIDDGCRFFQGHLFGGPMASTVDPTELVEARIASCASREREIAGSATQKTKRAAPFGAARV